MVAQVALALPGLDTIPVLGVALRTAHGNLTQVPNPAIQALYLAIMCADVPVLVPQVPGGARLGLPAPAQPVQVRWDGLSCVEMSSKHYRQKEVFLHPC